MSTPNALKIINLYASLNNTADASATPQDANAFRLQTNRRLYENKFQ